MLNNSIGLLSDAYSMKCDHCLEELYNFNNLGERLTFTETSYTTLINLIPIQFLYFRQIFSLHQSLQRNAGRIQKKYDAGK